VSASKGCRSSRASPTPMNLIGSFIVWRTATTTPLAVPSSLVREQKRGQGAETGTQLESEQKRGRS
jgi:hypothetical protein